MLSFAATCRGAASSLARALFKPFVLSLGLAVGLANTIHAGFTVSGTSVIQSNGTPFVMRGVNMAHVWWPQYTTTSLRDIAATGANTVRIVLGSGARWSRTSEADVASLIAQCKQNKLIAVLEVHDSTGWGEDGGAAPISTSAQYWVDIKNALIGQEDYVIINIANEPFGNTASGSWLGDTNAAVRTLRNAGLTHLLMVDAANWGQDWSGTMRSQAGQVLANDPLRRIVFSVHMYEVYGDRGTVDSYMTAFRNAGLALVVGEFGADHKGMNVDEASIMQLAQSYGIGYLGWSWAGNGAEFSSLDIAPNWNAASLSSWGNTLINGANGIKATSRTAAIYSSTPTDNTGNIALNRAVTVSSTEAGGNVASRAVDGSTATRWSSLYSDPQWIYVDLGGVYDITRVALNWEAAFARSYRVEVSNDASTWASIYSTTAGDGGIDDLSVTGRGRYVRIFGTVRSTQWGYSLWELAVYGTPAQNNNVAVTGITVSPGTASVAVNASVTLSATIAPSTATNKSVTWSSSNTAIATVDAAGVVTGRAAGSAVVTARSTDGGFTSSSTVTVTAAGGGGGGGGTVVTVPYSKDGVDDTTFTFSGNFNYINSWSTDLLTINGVDYTNKYFTRAQIPVPADGKYVVRYKGSLGWSHFEVK